MVCDFVSKHLLQCVGHWGNGLGNAVMDAYLKVYDVLYFTLNVYRGLVIKYQSLKSKTNSLLQWSLLSERTDEELRKFEQTNCIILKVT